MASDTGFPFMAVIQSFLLKSIYLSKRMRSFPEKISVMRISRLCRNPKGDELMTEAQGTRSQSYPSGGSGQQAAGLPVARIPGECVFMVPQ